MRILIAAILLLSNLVTALSMFFLAKDLDMLVAAPVDWIWATYGFARNQKGTPDVDENGVQVTPQNVVVQFVDYVDTGYVDVSGSPVPAPIATCEICASHREKITVPVSSPTMASHSVRDPPPNFESIVRRSPTLTTFASRFTCFVEGLRSLTFPRAASRAGCMRVHIRYAKLGRKRRRGWPLGTNLGVRLSRSPRGIRTYGCKSARRARWPVASSPICLDTYSCR